MRFGPVLRRHYKVAVAVACGIAAAAMAPVTQGFLSSDRLLYDLALWSHSLMSIRPHPAETPVVVVAIDTRTLEAPELKAIPRVFFGPVFADLLRIAFEHDAGVVGFDVLFAYDSTRFSATLDATFREELARGAGKIVLGRSAKIVPPDPLLLSAGDDALGFMELPRDRDGVTRVVPAAYRTADGATVPTFAAQIAAKVGGAMPHSIMLSPTWHLEDISTYSLIDVLRCRDPRRLRGVFAGRAVLVGTTVPDEDRFVAPSRFIRARQVEPQRDSQDDACHMPSIGASDSSSTTVAGVFVHAAAVESVLLGRNVTLVPTWMTTALAGLAGAAGAAIATLLVPAMALLYLAGGIVLLLAAGFLLLAAGLWLPVTCALLALPASAGVGYAARFLIEDYRRRWIQRIFGQYLAPALVDQLASSGEAPVLGGEKRDVTVMFADLSGFTALSGLVSPQTLMARTNRYLTIISEEIEKTGGHVDKYIGDAVMAIWGAPAENPAHAESATHAAFAIAKRVAALCEASIGSGDHGFWIKIGINSGDAVVGNVGSPRRLAYTVVGETVNIASRLESLPSAYGCIVVMGEATQSKLQGRYATCELDLVRLKGKVDAVAVFEPFEASPKVAEYISKYREALLLYRARHFADAERAWLALSYPGIVDPRKREQTAATAQTPNHVMAGRAAAYAAEPPPHDWQGEWIRDSK